MHNDQLIHGCIGDNLDQNVVTCWRKTPIIVKKKNSISNIDRMIFQTLIITYALHTLQLSCILNVLGSNFN
jgi:hypothetical protein